MVASGSGESGLVRLRRAALDSGQRLEWRRILRITRRCVMKLMIATHGWVAIGFAVRMLG